MDVELITIGDELLLGFTIDTNAAHLARELAAIGVVIVRRTTVGDDAAAIVSAVGEALDRTGAVITTGGLGPTSDDITKQSIAALFGRALRVDEEHLAWMEQRWRTRFGRDLPAANRQQALVPEGARKLVNRHGSAPGIWLEDERGRWVVMLPGVPREMRGMLTDTVLPLLRDRQTESGAATIVRSRTLRTTGIAESLLADRIAGMPEPLREVTLAYLPNAEGVDLRVTTRDHTSAEADSILTEAVNQLRAVLNGDIYAEEDADLAATVLDACRARHLTIAVGESCTGGLLGARLTSVPGSSDVVLGGIIAYHDDVKRVLLGVAESDLRAHGAVSEPVARQMASGARARTGASIGIGITGIAGPGGGTPEKPVGTVWVAVEMAPAARVVRLNLIGDRDEIRRRSAQAALALVRSMLHER